MPSMGLGLDGYSAVKIETTYGTPSTTSMTPLPTRFESSIKRVIQPIEQVNTIASRFPQKPIAGREVVTVEQQLDLNPTFAGMLFQWFLGTASSTGPVDGTYTHTWQFRTTNDTVGKSFTIHEAQGTALGRVYAGVQLREITIASDAEGMVSVTTAGVAESQATNDVARISSLAYPAVNGYTFANVKVYLTPSGGSEAEVLCDSIELVLNNGLDENRYKVGSAKTRQLQVNAGPSGSLKVNCDAEKIFKDNADIYKNYSARVVITSTGYAAGTTPFKVEITMPSIMLSPETEIPNTAERLKMELTFNIHTGGTTTNSGATATGAEIQVVDATTAWA